MKQNVKHKQCSLYLFHSFNNVRPTNNKVLMTLQSWLCNCCNLIGATNIPTAPKYKDFPGPIVGAGGMRLFLRSKVCCLGLNNPSLNSSTAMTQSTAHNKWITMWKIVSIVKMVVHLFYHFTSSLKFLTAIFPELWLMLKECNWMLHVYTLHNKLHVFCICMPCKCFLMNTFCLYALCIVSILFCSWVTSPCILISYKHPLIIFWPAWAYKLLHW